ncbi:MAG TPA: fucose isomerase [Bacteroidia bacterium]|nr:fucose isomerase [Bacteroidia bacterium]
MNPQRILLAASGDARLSANQRCWPTQAAMERDLVAAFSRLGAKVERLHPYDEAEGHGFLDSQKRCLEVFRDIDKDAPLVVAESVWQYSHHVLAGLIGHRGPILTVANWSGQWPGLVGLLNLNGCLLKAGVPFSTLWAEDFTDEGVQAKLREWLDTGAIRHDLSHCRAYAPGDSESESIGRELAHDFRSRRSIMGVFDEGCMGMYNAILPDELLFPLGVFKERLSQSALLHAMSEVTDEEAEGVFTWLVERGFQFHFGEDPATELTRDQVIEQCRMYVAACRLGDEFGCDAIGIQYQLGLKDMCAASDLVEGLLNNRVRPPVRRADGSIIRDGDAFPHFNEVDECAGLDALLIQSVHRRLGQPLETTLHDLRWGDRDASGTVDDYVWVLEISGAAPPDQHIGGIAGSHGHRQPAMYFPKGGATCSGVAKPGDLVWSRVFVAGGRLHLDIGLGRVVDLPAEETVRRLEATTKEWPIMHAVFEGVTRDQMMARHAANHVQVVYANNAESARQSLLARAAMAAELGIEVTVCGAGNLG